MNDQLIGTWKLVSVKARDLESGEERDVWGPNPQGYINYGPDGRMMVINTRGGRTKPKTHAPTPQEAADLFQGRRGAAPTWSATRGSMATACTCRRGHRTIRSTAG